MGLRRVATAPGDLHALTQQVPPAHEHNYASPFGLLSAAGFGGAAGAPAAAAGDRVQPLPGPLAAAHTAHAAYAGQSGAWGAANASHLAAVGAGARVGGLLPLAPELEADLALLGLEGLLDF